MQIYFLKLKRLPLNAFKHVVELVCSTWKKCLILIVEISIKV